MQELIATRNMKLEKILSNLIQWSALGTIASLLVAQNVLQRSFDGKIERGRRVVQVVACFTTSSVLALLLLQSDKAKIAKKHLGVTTAYAREKMAKYQMRAKKHFDNRRWKREKHVPAGIQVVIKLNKSSRSAGEEYKLAWLVEKLFPVIATKTNAVKVQRADSKE